MKLRSVLAALALAAALQPAQGAETLKRLTAPAARRRQ